MWRGFTFLLLAVTSLGCGKNKFQQEVETESASVKLARETVDGDYSLITTHELKKLLDDKTDMLLIDAMPLESSYQKQHIAGAKNFLFAKEANETESWRPDDSAGNSQADFEQLLGEDKDRLIIAYCGFVKCARSHNAAAWAVKLGYTNVKRYAGGIYAWKGAGFATESGG